MPKIYVVEIISGSSTIRLGDAHLISYKAAKLVLRWSAKTSAQLSLIRDHATLQTILTFRLASEGAVFWVSPPFPSAGHICRRKESPVRIDSPRQGGSVLVTGQGILTKLIRDRFKMPSSAQATLSKPPAGGFVLLPPVGFLP